MTGTCNGCHAHGTHATTGSASDRNLSATTDKTNYTVGETIIVTLSGGSKANAGACAGVRVYDSAGSEVSTRQRNTRCTRNPVGTVTSCDLPVQLSMTAQAGWTELYVAWAGNEYDATGASKGATISGAIGVGSRPLKDSGGNQISGHFEEVVKTAAVFAVSNTTPVANSGGGSSGAASSSAGGGAMNWVWMLGLFGVSLLGRKSKRMQVLTR